MKKEEIVLIIDVLALACLACFWLFSAPYMAIAAAALLLCNVIGGKIPYAIAWCWKKFGTFLGAVNSKIILSLVFYLALTPLSLLYRVFNREKAAGHRPTLFRDPESSVTRKSFEKLW